MAAAEIKKNSLLGIVGGAGISGMELESPVEPPELLGSGFCQPGNGTIGGSKSSPAHTTQTNDILMKRTNIKNIPFFINFLIFVFIFKKFIVYYTY